MKHKFKRSTPFVKCLNERCPDRNQFNVIPALSQTRQALTADSVETRINENSPNLQVM